LALLAWALPLNTAAAQVSVEVAMGTALNARTPLTVNQDGFPQIRHTASYSTRPLANSPYYQLQLSFWRQERTKAWRVGFLHHKLYLDNPPPEIQLFEITFGYNTLYGGHAWRKDKWVLSTGAGVLLANPNTQVRGLSEDRRSGVLDLKWYFAGATVYGAAQRRLRLSGKVFLGAEAKVTASMAWVSVSQGNARVPNLALHALFSVGWGP
jgi:hypothetical protein